MKREFSRALSALTTAIAVAVVMLAVSLPTDAKSNRPIDVEIAEYAIKIGGNRLVKKASDGKGLTLLRLGGIIQPKSKDYLLLTAKLERGIKFGPAKCSVSEVKLLSVIASRAKKLGAIDPKKNSEAAQLALAYFLVLERFQPRTDSVLLGLQQLKAEGVQGELDDVLNRRIDLDAVLGKKKLPPKEELVAKPEPEKDATEKRISSIPCDKNMASLKRTFDIKGTIRYVERKVRKKGGKKQTQRFGSYDGTLKLTTKDKITGDFTLKVNVNFSSMIIEAYGTQIRVPRSDVVGKSHNLVVFCTDGKLLAKSGENLNVIIAERKLTPVASKKPAPLEIAFQTKKGSYYSMRFTGTTITAEDD